LPRHRSRHTMNGALQMKIVLVYEDPFVQKFLETILRRNGFRVVFCIPSRAIELIRSSEEPVHLVITNAPLEFELVSADVPLLYVSAAPNPDLAARFSNCRMLAKPFRSEELLSAVMELTGPV